MSSDYIPFEIQSEIIKRLPVKSVVRCMSVSKQWKSLIGSAEFISSYHTCNTQPQHHLFIKYRLAKKVEYVSIVDDDTFPNQNSSLTVPPCLYYSSAHSSVNGLLCFYIRRKNIALLWNPSVRKTVSITIPNPLHYSPRHSYIGFGVCPINSDPKLVRITTIGVPTVLNWEVEVFTLSARVWKSVSNIPPDFTTRGLDCDSVFVEGVIYWRAYDTTIELPSGIWSESIISFDLISDEFGEVSLPGRLVRIMNRSSKISKVYESLGLFQYCTRGMTRFCDVWIMKDKSFTKILSIKAPNSCVFYKVLELRQNGEAIIETTDHTCLSRLEVYEPSSGRSSGFGNSGTFDSILVNPYMETLLLLDQSNSIIH